ncbi:HAD family hydrolase [Gilvimarinus algae]|uniref:HAD family hydrolase n=1 Tax=Gilvimarinus algae TaxID=3058037 RepID=A0ABT8TFA2_9GAMM|nr:HAD family hydrolase [Gilvimarinus sp. SDUM040014]MDO3380997.1 HAD family hydrolase [Gilvimarinus sp. SDUM040014]
MALAIFDLDNTLIAGDSDHRWGEFLIEQKLVDEAQYRRQNDAFYQDYQRAELDIDAYLRFVLAPLAQRSVEDWARIHQDFMATAIEPMLLPAAQQLLAEHRQRGDYLLIITATNGFITRPIAQKLGVDDILATDPEQVDGRYTGNYLGTPCFAAGKITHLNQWLKNQPHSLAGSYFYSDSINDLPLLETVSHPVAVNPDAQLAAIARERNWPTLDLRQAQ